MYLIRAHWGVETTHQILDVALQEDKHPWIESEPRAALVVAVIRARAEAGPRPSNEVQNPGLTPVA